MVLSLMAVLPAMAGNLAIGSLDLKVQGGSASGSGYTDVVQDTRVGTTLYVANSDKAYNKIVAQVTDSTANTYTGSAQTVTVTVKNSTTAASISGGVTLTETGNDTGVFSGSFLVQATPASSDIGASDGNNIRVAYAGTGDVVNATVDGTKPSISITSPADDTITRATTIDFAAIVTDAGSGIRTDVATGPNAAGPGNGAADADSDSLTSAEPRTLSTGKTVDIAIRRILASDPSTAFLTKTGDFSETAVWTATTNGFSFLSTRLLTAGEQRWNVQARDRAGNEAITDGLSTSTGSQPLKVTIDNTAAAISKVETGKRWDAATKTEKTTTARNSIKVYFSSAGGTIGGDDEAPTGIDKLDAATVDVTDFVVQTSSTNSTALPITSITFPNMKVATTGNPTIETRHIVYLTMTNDLASNAKPKVSLVGAINDLAGNATSVGDKVAVDKIPPKLTVTLSGGAGSTRQVAAGNKVGKEITVTITSDEPVSGTPTVNFTRFKYDATTSNQLEVLSFTTVTPTAVSGATNTWSTKQLNSVAGSTNGLVGVYVRATDLNSVAGGSGSGGTAAAGAANDTRVDLTTANLFEFDNNFAAASLTLTPNVTNATTTESTKPFIRIDFSEASEYSINTTSGDPASATPFDKFDCGKVTSTASTTCVPNKAGTAGSTPTTVEIDVQNTVTLTSITLDDVDVSASVGTVDADSFVLATSGLALGEHKLKFNGTDTIGNTYTTSQSYTFKVVARSAYSVALSPGWNLVSLPGDPTSTAIDDVVPSTHPATTILSYDPADANGPWLSAVRGSDGNWTGTLSTIVATRAYWVETGAFDAIKTLIPERSTATELPTVAVSAGWNLLPVIDLQLAKAPTDASLRPTGGPPVTTAPASGLDPDLYFASITWTVAYGFSTQANEWRKITPAVASNLIDNVGQGKGYWVWATKGGTLVP